MKHYNSAEDLALDPSFRRWVIHDDPEARKEWLEYLALYPEKEALVEKAKYFLIELTDIKYQMSDEDYLQTWENIEAGLYQHNTTSQPINTKSAFLRPFWYYLAASFIGLAFITAFWWYNAHHTTHTYRTAYGEMKQYMLPDSSVVILNANSVLRYTAEGFTSHRKVWIAGEAYFDIRKQLDPEGQPAAFTVQTKDLAVEVLGTQFNVNTRRQRTKVVLAEGKVKVNLMNTKADEAIYLSPGDMVTYTPDEKQLHKAVVNPDTHAAWKQHELVFENTRITEIIHVLEDTYGMQIVLENKALANRRYTGAFHNPSPELILLSLETLFNLKITREDDVIILK